MPPGDPSPERRGQLLPLHPMTVADILDGAFLTWRAVIGPAVLLVLILMGPYELISNLVLATWAPQTLQPDSLFMPEEMLDLGGVGVALLVSLGGVVVWVFAATAVATLVVRADRSEPRDLGAVLRATVRRSGVVLVDVLLLGLLGVAAMIGAIVIAFIPIAGALALIFTFPIGIGIAVALGALIVPVAVVEQGGPIETLTRAFWVLRVRFWRTIGITWLMLIVLIGVSLGLTSALEFTAAAAGPASWVVFALTGILISVVQVPVLSLAALLVHHDARIVREAYDLEVRVGRLVAS